MALLVLVGANSKTAGFCLWQTKSGIKFKSIETIINQKEVAQEYFFNRNNEGLGVWKSWAWFWRI